MSQRRGIIRILSSTRRSVRAEAMHVDSSKSHASKRSHAHTQDDLHTRAFLLGQSFRHASASRERGTRHGPCSHPCCGFEVLSPRRKEASYEPEQEAGTARVP